MKTRGQIWNTGHFRERSPAYHFVVPPLETVFHQHRNELIRHHVPAAPGDAGQHLTAHHPAIIDVDNGLIEAVDVLHGAKVADVEGRRVEACQQSAHDNEHQSGQPAREHQHQAQIAPLTRHQQRQGSQGAAQLDVVAGLTQARMDVNRIHSPMHPGQELQIRIGRLVQPAVMHPFDPRGNLQKMARGLKIIQSQKVVITNLIHEQVDASSLQHHEMPI